MGSSVLRITSYNVCYTKLLRHETAGLLRAIMDLKEIESGALKESSKRFQEQFVGQRVRDAKLWLEFIKNVSK